MTKGGYKELEDYFHRINAGRINAERINQPTQGETEMSLFEKLKALFTKPTKFVDEKPDFVDLQQPELEDYWAFELRTNEWVDVDGTEHAVKHTCIIEPHEGTWMEVLDKVLDELEKHYGYNIKEQVYYSVALPLNMPNEAGYGRCLNDEVFQQLLLAYPEVYELPAPMQYLKGE